MNNYKELVRNNWKREEIVGLMKKEDIGDRWCLTIKDCIDKDSMMGKHGKVNICTVFDNEDEMFRCTQQCYEEFVHDYLEGMIKEGII